MKCECSYSHCLAGIGHGALNAQIKGSVNDEQGNTTSQATNSLLKLKDKWVVKLELTKDSRIGSSQLARDSF